MGRRGWLIGLATVVVVLALGYAAWSAFRSADAQICYACQRPIHAHTRTLASVGGHPRLFCCPACALSQHAQVTQLTALLTGKPLAPDSAYLVKGSDVNMCVRTQEIIDADKRPENLRYDRCNPSLIAFSQQNEAQEFARAHGGEVTRLSQIKP